MGFDFSSVEAPFRMQPGLRRIAAGSVQLTPNRLGCAALTEKLAVLAGHREQALLAAPGFDPRPALHALLSHAAAEHPQALGWDGDAAVDALHLGWSLRAGRPHGDGPAAIGRCLAALPADWRLAGLLCLAFSDDFAVIDGDSGCIPWLAVCLPSHWAPEDKVGRHFAAVHAPVADNRLLVAAGAHLARLVVGGDDRWERFVWTLTPHRGLDAHPKRRGAAGWPSGADADANAEALAAQTYFRTEHQTFIPVPAERQAVFTIHVEVQPLGSAVDTPDKARRLHAALATMSDAVLAYRDLTEPRDRLLAWLAGLAAAARR